MNTIINIKDTKAKEEVGVFGRKKYSKFDVKFTNTHLRQINTLIRNNLFSKNDLYINSITLWELMQSEGKSESHNYHGLTSDDIIECLKSLISPYAICKTKLSRHAIITQIKSHYEEPLFLILEVGSGLFNNIDANINKVVTIYPKSDIDNYLDKYPKKDILYRIKK